MFLYKNAPMVLYLTIRKIILRRYKGYTEQAKTLVHKRTSIASIETVLFLNGNHISERATRAYHKPREHTTFLTPDNVFYITLDTIKPSIEPSDMGRHHKTVTFLSCSCWNQGIIPISHNNQIRTHKTLKRWNIQRVFIQLFWNQSKCLSYLFPLHLNTYMLWVYGYYTYFNSFSAGRPFFSTSDSVVLWILNA